MAKTDRQTDKHMYIAMYRLNQPRGRGRRRPKKEGEQGKGPEEGKELEQGT